jgi:hypothetical protein
VKLSFKSDQGAKAKLENIRFIGSGSEQIRFDVKNLSVRIPEGSYRLESSYLRYGPSSMEGWMVSMSNGPEIEIRSDKVAELDFGEPGLTVSVVEEAKRWDTDTGSSTMFTAGEALYISRITEGRSKETYGQFSKLMETMEYEMVEPRLRIMDAEGNVAVDESLPYG